MAHTLSEVRISIPQDLWDRISDETIDTLLDQLNEKLADVANSLGLIVEDI